MILIGGGVLTTAGNLLRSLAAALTFAFRSEAVRLNEICAKQMLRITSAPNPISVPNSVVVSGKFNPFNPLSLEDDDEEEEMTEK
mmetsp:Transcript_8351/g.9124  ORF Transcript_8351/g.9124 Transcript_8351/m.9124 type:complete len:85 (-) Transcript_8351:292-546(-)